jgi:hypothetical protein
MNVLAELAAVDVPASIRVEAHWRSFDRSEEWEATVDHAKQQWSAADLTNNRHLSFSDGLVHTERESTPSESYRSRAPAAVLQMLFPEHLGVWGRQRDPFFPLSMTDIGETGRLLTVQHKNDEAILETLVLDMKLGIVLKHFGMLTMTTIDVCEVT